MKAFPTPTFSINDEARVTAVGGEGGMDLRDYFAAKVLVNSYKEYAANVHSNNKGIWDRDWRVLVAKDAYELADAMMKARQP